MAGHAKTALLVGGGHEAEEQLAASCVERREPELVEQDQIGAQQPVDEAADGVVGEAAIEGLDEVGGDEVAGAVASLYGGVSEWRAGMHVIRTRPPDLSPGT